MKIAITAQQDNMDGPVDPRFGRARWFIVYDTETDEFTASNNEQNLNAAQGAGIQAAQNVARLGVAAVITGHVGPKAFTTLQAAKIKIFTGASGTVKEAIGKFQAKKLQTTDKADVEGHWM